MFKRERERERKKNAKEILFFFRMYKCPFKNLNKKNELFSFTLTSRIQFLFLITRKEKKRLFEARDEIFNFKKMMI